jgi:protein associated with RNAse G/E
MWKSGTHVIIRGIAHNRVWIAHAVTVVEDTPDLLVTYLQPGAHCKVPHGLIERKYTPNLDGLSRWDEQDSREWKLDDWRWQHRHVLILMPPEAYYAVYWFWSTDFIEFEGWYVNFQLPFHKTEWSIDTLDLEIDLIIDPDGVWRWKDEPEYLTGVRRGSIPAVVASRVEDAREEILMLFSNGSPFFDRKWLSWQPEPDWEIPQLPPDWDIVD